MKSMKTVVGIALLALSSAAFAGSSVVLDLTTQRYDADKNYNENNLGAGYAFETTTKYTGDIEAQVGFFHNEDDRTSVYARATKYLMTTSVVDHQVRLGVQAGVATGYDRANLVATVAGVANVKLSDRVSFNVLVSPYRENGDTKAQVGAQLQFALK